MKVLLINPPSNAPNPIMPLGLAYLAAALEAAVINIDIIDAWAEGYTIEDLDKQIKDQQPDIAGITMMSPMYASAMRTVDSVRRNSNAKIVVGGPHPSALPEQCLQDNPNIDFAVAGEGEKALVDLVKALSGNGKSLDTIKGLTYRNGDKLLSTGHAQPIENLDALPFPARHLFPVAKYKTHPPYGKKNPYMTLITSRGCPFQCTYCSKSVYGSRYRTMSPQRVVLEIRHIIKKYGIREIHFYDDDFTINMKRAEEICDLLIQEPIRISWSCTTRVDLVNENLLNKMRKSGCWLISYGVESADPNILKNIKKGYTIEQVQNAFSLTKKAGIRTVAYLMVGLPGETKETINKTIDFSLKLDPDFVSWGITALYPGSSLYESAKNGKLGETDIRYTYKDKSWHASGSPYGDGYAIIYEEQLSRNALQEYGRLANRAFYLRPRYLLRFIFKIRSFYELFHFIKGGVQFFFWIIKRRS